MEILRVCVGKYNGKDVDSYSLRNSKGFGINALNYGAIITDILVPDKNGVIENVVMKYKDINCYKENPSYYGAFIGRTSGRIANGKVMVKDKVLNLNKNYGYNQGHGGENGFSKKFLNVITNANEEEAYIEFSYLSPCGEEGYPGNLEVKVRYTINEENEFKISYYAISDEDTLVNLTNHSYFNLSGNCKANILNHYLYIDSDFLVELNEKEVPTGKTIKIDKTPFDFNSPKTIGRDIEEEDYQLKIGNGYDHCWLLNGGNDIKIRLYHKESGRQMDVYTDQNSVVLYSLNYPDDEILECNKKANRRDALAIETQSPPIGENNIFANYSLLKKGEEYIKETIYKFSIIK
ncbi:MULTISPECIES: aldose epimerase family protein [unclassified Clostridium]|uniref:aldose epimerase family protein n=1 Tax=unclassified Clostridium TaxID=2614128 RepID=UPI0025C1CE85|nr:aldose epimerase family protein [Clostridium sp.]MDY6226750.1 aldose epimerase family protein [Clostridium sp.]